MQGKMKVLVVDDEPKMRELVSLYLTKENYQVVTAEDGLAALKVLEKDDNFQLLIVRVKSYPAIRLLKKFGIMNTAGIKERWIPISKNYGKSSVISLKSISGPCGE